MLRPIVNVLEDFYILYSRIFKGRLPDYVDIHTTFGQHTFATETGVLITPLRYNGLHKMFAGDEFKQGIDGLYHSLGSYFELGYHNMQVVYERDPDRTSRVIGQALRPAYTACRNLNLGLQSLMDERAAHLNRRCVHENVYMSVISTPESFSKFERDANTQKRNARIASRPRTYNAQKLDFVFPQLADSHHSLVTSVVNDFKAFGADITRLPVNDMLRDMRMMVDPGHTDDAWSASLAGDPLPLRMPGVETDDYSCLFWPAIQDQLFTQDAHYPDTSTITIGNRSFSSIYVELPPKKVELFSTLLKRITDKTIPFRMAFYFGGGSYWQLDVKKAFASVLAFTDPANVEIYKSAKAMQQQIIQGLKGVQLQVSLTTWAPADNLPLLKSRVETVIKALQGWGSCDVQIERGDPALGFISSLPAAACRNIGEKSLPPFDEVLKMLPLTRQYSPWQQGSVLFTTLDGKPWPYQPASSQQQVCIDLFIAVTRSGKSTLANTINIGYVLNHKTRTLPYLSIIDIGGASEGAVSLIQDYLPPEQRYMAIYKRLKKTADHAINCFDTQLGCRMPLSFETSFLTNFLTLLVTPVELERPYPNMTALVKDAIAETYKTLADDEFPKRYEPGLCAPVDDALAAIDHEVDAKSTWWEVVDALFDNHCIYEAYLANRFAVPIINDIISVVQNSESIKKRYADSEKPVMVADTGERLIDAFIRLLSSVSSNYPNLVRPTQFDVGQARIVSLDLQEVAPKGGEDADRQTSIMFMVARHALMNKFFLHPDHLDEIPQRFKNYHGQRINELMESVKRGFIDELHRFSHAPRVREQFNLDVKEGGKANLHMSFASQSIAHFSEDMLENATNLFILNLGQGINKVAKRLELSQAEILALKTRVNGPSAAGCPFLMRFNTRSGSHSQLLMLSSPAEELWALSSTPQDKALRRYISARVGAERGRRILVKYFPNGSALDTIEQRAMFQHNEVNPAEDAESTVIEQLANEILSKENEGSDYAVL